MEDLISGLSLEEESPLFGQAVPSLTIRWCHQSRQSAPKGAWLAGGGAPHVEATFSTLALDLRNFGRATKY